MSSISINTYFESPYVVVELHWYDERLRKPQSVRAGMDRDRVEQLIAALQELMESAGK